MVGDGIVTEADRLLSGKEVQGQQVNSLPSTKIRVAMLNFMKTGHVMPEMRHLFQSTDKGNQSLTGKYLAD